MGVTTPRLGVCFGEDGEDDEVCNTRTTCSVSRPVRRNSRSATNISRALQESPAVQVANESLAGYGLGGIAFYFDSFGGYNGAL